ncbi:MAG: hypothetical protein ACTHMD_17845 [Flavisolibacter sp.]
MPSIEKEIKRQYAKVFKKSDWQSFKLIAEYYLAKAAILKRKDIEVGDTFKLLIRNIQKRLFLGIGCELLVKACYLKHGYIINKPKDKTKGTVIKSSSIKGSELEAEDTFTLSPLIDNLKKVVTFSDWTTIEKGLKILKVFRNKEGHVAVLWHKYKPQNYRDIEAAMTLFYKEAFEEDVEFQIFMEETDNGVFKITE